MPHNPQIDPIFIEGTNGAGVILSHGFTGTPDSVRSVARALGKAGFTVSAPLLAGHGTTPENCAQTNWHDWYESIEEAYQQLQKSCSKIFVAGLSLGSLLTLKLSIDHPQAITAAACLATPLYLKPWTAKLLPVIENSPIKFFWKYQKKLGVDIKDPNAKGNFWNYDRMPLSCIYSLVDLQKVVRDDLAKIHTPLLLIHSRHDSTAPYDSMNQVARQVSSTITETVTLENSYHVITLDYEKEWVAQKVTDFFRRFL